MKDGYLTMEEAVKEIRGVMEETNFQRSAASGQRADGRRGTGDGRQATRKSSRWV